MRAHQNTHTVVSDDSALIELLSNSGQVSYCMFCEILNLKVKSQEHKLKMCCKTQNIALKRHRLRNELPFNGAGAVYMLL